MGHYTPQDCQHQFGTRYRALMERFQNVVRFGIVGHTHREDYNISNSISNPAKPVFVSEVASSITTYSGNNPSFKVIDFDKATMVPVNMKTYYLDLADANETNEPKWALLHDYLETYQMKDLSPASFKKLSQRLFTDPEVQHTFSMNRHAQSPAHTGDMSPLYLFCSTATSEMHEKNLCNKTGAMSSFGEDFKLLSKDFPHAAVDRIIGNWIDVTKMSKKTKK